MSSPIRRQPLAASLMMCFFALSLAGPTSAEDGHEKKVWDPAVVTKLAMELEQALQDIYQRSLKAPPQQTVLQQRERDATQGVIRRARDLGEEYARRMRSGRTREATEPYFRAVVEEVEHVWLTAGKAVPMQSAKPGIVRLQGILDELRTWYDTP